jgi:mono/diheme cytochrome c family protein
MYGTRKFKPGVSTLCRNLGAILTLAAVGMVGMVGMVGCGSNGSSGDAKQGEALVMQYACGSCHQSTQASDGTLSGQTTPQAGTMAYGANITPDTAAGIGAWTDEQIIRSIRDGVDDEGKPLCPTMPRHKDLTDSQLQSIVAYLRSLPAVARQIPESQCSTATDAGVHD